MNISRLNAVKRIEEYIELFQDILSEVNCDNIDKKEYYSANDETIVLLSDLFSEAEAHQKFEDKEILYIIPLTAEKKIENYKEKIRGKIKKLEDYKEKIQHFWFNGEIQEDKKVVEKHSSSCAFMIKKRFIVLGKI